MLLLKNLALLVTCAALASCQTQKKKPADESTKKTTKATKTISQDASKPGVAKPGAAIPAKDKKPAETFQEVATNVQDAAKAYVEARAEEKANPPEVDNPEAAKIEEISAALDPVIEDLANKPNEELTAILGDEDARAALTDVTMEQVDSPKQKDGSAKGLGVGLAITGGLVFVSSAALTVNEVRKLAVKEGVNGGSGGGISLHY